MVRVVVRGARSMITMAVVIALDGDARAGDGVAPATTVTTVATGARRRVRVRRAGSVVVRHRCTLKQLFVFGWGMFCERIVDGKKLKSARRAWYTRCGVLLQCKHTTRACCSSPTWVAWLQSRSFQHRCFPLSLVLWLPLSVPASFF